MTQNYCGCAKLVYTILSTEQRRNTNSWIVYLCSGHPTNLLDSNVRYRNNSSTQFCWQLADFIDNLVYIACYTMWLLLMFVRRLLLPWAGHRIRHQWRWCDFALGWPFIVHVPVNVYAQSAQQSIYFRLTWKSYYNVLQIINLKNRFPRMTDDYGKSCVFLTQIRRADSLIPWSAHLRNYQNITQQICTAV